MQAVGIVLLLISLGTIIVPVGAVVYVYQDNLPSLIIPPEIQGLIDGDGSIFLAGNANSEGGLSSLIMPTYVSSTVDTQAKTFAITVNVTNFLNYSLSLNTINATVLDQNGTELASIYLSAPVTLLAGQWQLVTISGQWTQAGEYYFNNQSDANFSNVTLSNIVFDVNGIIISNNQPKPLGEQTNAVNRGDLRDSLFDNSGGSGKGGSNPIDDSED